MNRNVIAAVIAPFVLLAIGQTEVRAAEVALPPFYEAASALKPEGKLGAVVAREAVATAIPNAEAWRIAYLSSDVLDRPTVVTALVVAPRGPVPQGGRPIVAWAHGTTGSAQNCGPSQVLDPAQDLNEYFLIGGTSWTDFGIPALADFIGKGFVVVATDYQGLGGGGTHQYAVAGTQARDVIDSIRAVGSLGLTGDNRKAAMFGWSQGGGAALAAASLPSYVQKTGTAFDGVDLVGFAALAPDDVAVLVPPGASDAAAATAFLQSVEKTFSGSIFNFTHFAMTMWATAATYPGLATTDIFTADGATAIQDVLSKKCMHPAADTLNYAFGDDYRSLLLPQPNAAVAWTKALIDGSVPPVKPFAPVVIYWGTKDTTNPPVMGELYRKQMCALGGNVARMQLPGEQTHFSTPGASRPYFVPWIADRLAGKAATDGCSGG